MQQQDQLPRAGDDIQGIRRVFARIHRLRELGIPGMNVRPPAEGEWKTVAGGERKNADHALMLALACGSTVEGAARKAGVSETLVTGCCCGSRVLHDLLHFSPHLG